MKAGWKLFSCVFFSKHEAKLTTKQKSRAVSYQSSICISLVCDSIITAVVEVVSSD